MPHNRYEALPYTWINDFKNKLKNVHDIYSKKESEYELEFLSCTVEIIHLLDERIQGILHCDNFKLRCEILKILFDSIPVLGSTRLGFSTNLFYMHCRTVIKYNIEKLYATALGYTKFSRYFTMYNSRKVFDNNTRWEKTKVKVITEYTRCLPKGIVESKHIDEETKNTLILDSFTSFFEDEA